MTEAHHQTETPRVSGTDTSAISPRKSTRPTLRRMRDNLDAIKIGLAGLGVDQRLKRQILQRELQATGDPAMAAALNSQYALTRQHKAARMHATVQFPPNDTTARRRKDYRSPEGFNECGLNVGRSRASKSGDRMERKKTGFPNVMRHMTTINLAIVPTTGNLKATTDIVRPRMRCAFTELTEGFQVVGMYQFVMKPAADLADMFPSSEWPQGFDPVSRPDEVFGMLHWHGDISDPWKTKRQVRKIVSSAFRGKRRVCVAKVMPEWFTTDGYITGGAQGFLEYASMDKTETKFTNMHQIKDSIIGHARLSYTWKRKNLTFSMGKSVAVSGIVIDDDRVAELELMERLDFVKSKWDKLSDAEQFIHLWFSGMVKVIRKRLLWPDLNYSSSELFLKSLALVKNWCSDESAQDVDFFEFTEPLLE